MKASDDKCELGIPKLDGVTILKNIFSYSGQALPKDTADPEGRGAGAAGSAALGGTLTRAVNSVCSMYSVCSVCSVYSVYSVYNVNSVYSVYSVYSGYRLQLNVQSTTMLYL